MSFDKILSRFKIQTKVLVFIFPFVISISAVGLVGLYALGLLQGRLVISNSVMTSLSGFRDVSSAMSQFLGDSNEKTLAGVKDRLSQQKDYLQGMLGGLEKNADGADELQSAIDTTAVVDQGVSSLWDLYKQEQATRGAIGESLKAMVGAQVMLADTGSQSARQIQQMEGGVKNELYGTGRVLDVTRTLVTLVEGYNAAPGMDKKIAFLSGQLNDLNKSIRKLGQSLPADKKIFADQAKEAFGELKSIVDAKETDDRTMPRLAAAIQEITSVSAGLSAYNDALTVQSIKKLADAEGPKVKADAMQDDTRRVAGSVYSIQIDLARFLVAPGKENRDAVVNDFKIVRKDMEALSGSAKGEAFLDTLNTTLVPAMTKMEADTATLTDIHTKRQAAFEDAERQIDTIWGKLTAFAETQKNSAGVERAHANTISISATVIGIIIAALAGIGLVLTFKKPIGQITAAMRKLAEGMLETSIEGEARVDEIGDMARALGVFKENALEKVRMEHRSAEERAATEAERARNDAEKRSSEEQIAFAVSALASGLERLSNGDLSRGIDTPFNGSLDRLRTDFNTSIMRLRDTLQLIQGNALTIQANGSAMRGSADELSRRTESQAASLEQTAAAVDEITVTVRGSAERAREANTIVMAARKSADNSSVVVGNAVEAMSRIEGASKRIEQIIDVIEDIAFQTNLLALNAGIEAARAGEAGKGFAVVAMEVRELAQRSGGAAKEIKSLIETAAREVSSGVDQVQQTGDALGTIGRQISEISAHMNVIVTAAQDQSAALHEVNGTVNQMDQMTQANAAMVEEANAMSQQLSIEADQLMQLVGQFNLGSDGNADYHQGYRAA